jgi:hypothetical protein
VADADSVEPDAAEPGVADTLEDASAEQTEVEPKSVNESSTAALVTDDRPTDQPPSSDSIAVADPEAGDKTQPADDAPTTPEDVAAVATPPEIQSSSDADHADSADLENAADHPGSADAVPPESDLDHDVAAGGSERTGERP